MFVLIFWFPSKTTTIEGISLRFVFRIATKKEEEEEENEKKSQHFFRLFDNRLWLTVTSCASIFYFFFSLSSLYMCRCSHCGLCIHPNLRKTNKIIINGICAFFQNILFLDLFTRRQKKKYNDETYRKKTQKEEKKTKRKPIILVACTRTDTMFTWIFIFPHLRTTAPKSHRPIRESLLRFLSYFVISVKFLCDTNTKRETREREREKKSNSKRKKVRIYP